jgi:hypothetical protein
MFKANKLSHKGKIIKRSGKGGKTKTKRPYQTKAGEKTSPGTRSFHLLELLNLPIKTQ